GALRLRSPLDGGRQALRIFEAFAERLSIPELPRISVELGGVHPYRLVGGVRASVPLPPLRLPSFPLVRGGFAIISVLYRRGSSMYIYILNTVGFVRTLTVWR